jgi:hypothetical protein
MKLEILKEHRAEMQLQIFKDEPLMSDKDIAYDKGYINGITYVIDLLEGAKSLPEFREE